MADKKTYGMDPQKEEEFYADLKKRIESEEGLTINLPHFFGTSIKPVKRKNKKSGPGGNTP